MKQLDFLILGAQKSGTTTLFQLLSEHPEIYVPPGKELPFFNHKGVTAARYASFMAEAFSAAPDGVQVGKITPHYLSDPAVPTRLAALSSSTKLAVILRDPVERAFSHYRMSVRRGLETRSFADAIDAMLQPDALNMARDLLTGRESENQTYVVWGEYGRLLAPYADKISDGDFILLSTRELAADPAAVMVRLLAFIGLGMVALPSLGKKLHQGGDRERLPLQKIAKSIAPVRWIWRKIPSHVQARVLFKVDQMNVVRSPKSVVDQPRETLIRLRTHFAKDAEQIRQLTGWQPDWLK